MTWTYLTIRAPFTFVGEVASDDGKVRSEQAESRLKGASLLPFTSELVEPVASQRPEQMRIGQDDHLDHGRLIFWRLRPFTVAQIAPIDEVLVVDENKAQKHDRIENGVLEPSIHHLKTSESSQVSKLNVTLNRALS